MKRFRRHRSSIAVAFVVSGLLATSVSAAPKPTELLSKMRNALYPGEDFRAGMQLELENPWGEEVVWAGKMYRKGNRQRIVMSSPIDIRGTELVAIHQDDGTDRMKLYLPAIRRIRTIQRDLKGAPFLGTDFNFENLAFERLDYEKHEIAGDATFGERSCTRVRSIPEDELWYGEIIRCIGDETHLPLRTEYYDRGGVLYKVRTIDRIETIDGHPTAMEITMKTVPEETSTTLSFTNVEYDTNFDVELTRSSFRRESPLDSPSKKAEKSAESGNRQASGDE